ncbi:MAG: MFS transporter [Acidobacteria bacterium]|nr:MFS transporter [Acidobacteriota bacterium]
MTPTRARYKVLAWCVALAGITYLDRICIAILAPHVTADLKLSPVQMSVVFSAFTVAYGLFEMPTGYWGDRIGTRRVMTRIVAWWSTFTIATAGAFNYGSLLVIRFLFGAGEAGAFPNSGKTISMWFPMHERGRAQGIFFAGAHITGAVTPLAIGAMLTVMHWRTVFIVFGCIGFLWAIGWYRWFRDDPAEHPAVNEAERDYILASRSVAKKGPFHWGEFFKMFSHGHLLLLCFMYFTQSYGFYFFITWCPTYLEQARGFSKLSLGLASGLPLLLCAFADILGGETCDWAVRRFGTRWGRGLVGAFAMLGAAAAMLAGTNAPDPTVAIWLLAIAAGMGSFVLGAAWSTALDMGGAKAGLVGAVMNTAGQVGGALSPIVLGTVLQKTGSWDVPLYATGFLYILGGLCWLVIDARRARLG